MNLPDFVALWTGMTVEILLLWETSLRGGEKAAAGILSPRLGRFQEWIGLVLLAGFSIVLGLNLLGLGTVQVDLDMPLINFLFVLLGLFLFFYGLVDPRLLPRVNEQVVVVVNLVVLLGLATGGQDFPAWVWLAALLPSLVTFSLALSPRPAGAGVKAFIYFWYLLCLVLLTVQNEFPRFFATGVDIEGQPFEFYLLGITSIFLLLHSLFSARFFLMLSALVLPRNRHYISLSMPHLFNDEQISRLRFVLILAGVVGLTVVNTLYEFVAPLTLANLLVLLAVHFLDRIPLLTVRT